MFLRDRRAWIRFPERRESKLTVCVAGIHKSYGKNLIIAAFDRKLTTMGGYHSSDGPAWKMSGLNNKWYALLAGDVSAMTAIADAVKAGVRGTSGLNFRDFARHSLKHYKEERKRLVESEVLTKYDVDSYREYLSLKQSDRKLFDAISEKVSDFDDGLNLIMCGFDKDKSAHVFAITGPGNVQFCDIPGRAVAGSGAHAAHFSLDRHPYDKSRPLGECIYAVLAAKFSAEAAEGVGRDTALFVLSPELSKKDQAALFTRTVNTVKDQWRSLPRIPEGTVALLEKDFAIFTQDQVTQKRMRKVAPMIRLRSSMSKTTSEGER